MVRVSERIYSMPFHYCKWDLGPRELATHTRYRRLRGRFVLAVSHGSLVFALLPSMPSARQTCTAGTLVATRKRPAAGLP